MSRAYLRRTTLKREERRKEETQTNQEVKTNNSKPQLSKKVFEINKENEFVFEKTQREGKDGESIEQRQRVKGERKEKQREKEEKSADQMKKNQNNMKVYTFFQKNIVNTSIFKGRTKKERLLPASCVVLENEN